MQRSTSPLWLALALPAASLFGAGCQEPCEALADRICNCQPDQFSRQQCRNERVESQQGRVATAAEQEACAAALDTCNCEVLEQNQVELCAFTREGGADVTVDGGS